MTPTALKEAAQVGVPRDKIVGSGAVLGTGHGAGRGGGPRLHLRQLSGHGETLPAHPGDAHYVYARGKGPGPEGDVGTVRWIRGMLHGVLTAEALRTAMREFGNQPLTGAQVQWGLDHLTLTAASLKELGAEGLLPPITLSCRDHEGGGSVKFQQWDGQQWTVLTDWMAPDQALVRPLVEASAAQVCAGEGDHAAGLPIGAGLLGRSRVCSTDVHECRSGVERGRDMIGPVVPGSHVGPPQPVFISPGYLQAPETVMDAILLQPNDGEPAQ